MLKRLIRLWPFHNLRIGYLHDGMFIKFGRGSPFIVDNWDIMLLAWNYRVWKNSQRPGVQKTYRRYRDAMDKIHAKSN